MSRSHKQLLALCHAIEAIDEPITCKSSLARKPITETQAATLIGTAITLGASGRKRGRPRTHFTNEPRVRVYKARQPQKGEHYYLVMFQETKELLVAERFEYEHALALAAKMPTELVVTNPSWYSKYTLNSECINYPIHPGIEEPCSP